MNRQNYYWFFITALVLASCGFYEPIDDMEEEYNSLLNPESGYFDFSTKAKANVNIDYGPLGAGALIELFDEFPEELDADSMPIISKEPFFAGFADDNGVLSATVTIPSHVSNLWIHTDQYGLPANAEAAVEDDFINFSYKQFTKATTRAAATRSVENIQVWPYPEGANYNVYTLHRWEDRYGTIIDENGLISEGSVTADVIHAIQKALWYGKDQKPDRVYNDELLSDVLGVINTELKEDGINAQGQPVKYESAEVWMTFLSEGAWNHDTFGYYIYKTDNPPKSREEAKKLKKFIVFPNTSIAGSVPFESSKPSKKTRYPITDAPCAPNTKVQLLYVDDEGNISKHFPTGYSIGYFVVSKSDGVELKADTKFAINFNDIIYSDKALNTDSKPRTVSFMTPDGVAIYGFEDKYSWDHSYEDVLFTIETTPKECIANPERRILDTSTSTLYAQNSTFYTYMFEDLWPNKGDYDMNDVIVELDRNVVFDKNNIALSITDKFTPVQPVGSASNTNAFAFFNSTIMACNPTIECSDGVQQDASGALIVFTNTNAQRGQEVSVTYKFEAGKGPSINNLSQDDDAFIITNAKDPTQSNRVEVHSPGFQPTSLANQNVTDDNQSIHYLSQDGDYPFSMQVQEKNFTPVSEGISIEKEYPSFGGWVSSFGKQFGDWYKSFVKFIFR